MLGVMARKHPKGRIPYHKLLDFLQVGSATNQIHREAEINPE
jgi:hypothetical protein